MLSRLAKIKVRDLFRILVLMVGFFMLELPKDKINGAMHCNGTMVQLKLQEKDSGNGPAGRQ